MTADLVTVAGNVLQGIMALGLLAVGITLVATRDDETKKEQ